MPASGHFVFDTALGWIGLRWSAAGITGLQLPSGDREATRRRLLARAAPSEGEPATEPGLPADIARAVALLRRYAEGEPTDLSALPVDLSGIAAFGLDIYAAARRLRHGETTTYGGLAQAAGHPGMARETGEALGLNPVPLIVPCHRILAAGGRIGGFSAPGGSATKLRLLALEGVRVGPAPPTQQAFAF